MINLVKFRAWHKKEKALYLVRTLHFGENGEIVGVTGMGRGQVWSIDEVELDRFVQLDDRFGKDIYERDIVALFGGFRAVVKFGLRPGSHANQVRIGFDLEKDGQVWDFPCEHGRMEVLGNVHENQELLYEPHI